MIYLRPPICLKQIHKKMLAAETVKVESKCKLEYLSILETTSHSTKSAFLCVSLFLYSKWVQTFHHYFNLRKFEEKLFSAS